MSGDQVELSAPAECACRKALEVISEALKEPSGGSYWPARAFLDERDIFNDDLNDLRVLTAVAVSALSTASCESLRAENERLRAELAAACEKASDMEIIANIHHNALFALNDKTVSSLRAELAAAQEQIAVKDKCIAELEAGLKPFAEYSTGGWKNNLLRPAFERAAALLKGGE